MVEEIQAYEHTYSNNLPTTADNPTGSCSTEIGMINCADDLSGKYLAHITGQSLASWNLDYNSNG